RVAGILKLPASVEVPFDITMPLSVAQETAVLVGNYLADTPFQALNGHTFQSIETWDDEDETTAQSIADAIKEVGIGDMQGGAPHLLAGATLAIIATPDSYEEVTEILNGRLDRCLRLDHWTY